MWTFIVYLLNVFTVFAGIGCLIAFFHVSGAMRRAFGRGAMVGLPLVLGFLWTFFTHGAATEALTFIGVGLVRSFLCALVVAFVGGWVCTTRLNESDAAIGRLSLRPVLVTWAGCMVYVVLILGLNMVSIGQANFWADAADLSKHGHSAEH